MRVARRELAARLADPDSVRLNHPSVRSKARLASEAKNFLAILDGVREQGIRHIKSRRTPYRSLSLEHLLDRGWRAPAHLPFP